MRPTVWAAASSPCRSVSSLKDDAGSSVADSDSASEEAFDVVEQDGALTRFHGRHSNKASRRGAQDGLSQAVCGRPSARTGA